jgi:hypothetical protein
MVPKVGRFSYRMAAVDKYIENQRRYKRWWEIRLEVGMRQNVNRTIDAARFNIDKINHNIIATLRIKEDYLTNHIRYDRKGDYILKTSKANMDRLEEYLDVSGITIKDPAAYSIQKRGVPDMSEQSPPDFLPEQTIDDILSYLQPVQMRPDSKDSQSQSQMPSE